MDNDTTSPVVKRCSKCGEVKSLEMFPNLKRSKDGKYPSCKACESFHAKQRYIAHREEILDYATTYRANNKDKIRERDRNYRSKNRDKIRTWHREYYQANKERMLEYFRQRYITHHDIIRARSHIYYLNGREKRREYNKRWQEANPGVTTKRVQEWRKKNPERNAILRERERLAKDPAQEKERLQIWRQSNRDRKRASEHKRNALKKEIGGYFTDKDIANMEAIQQGECAYCRRLGQFLTIEHIIPVTRKGSSNDPWNLCLACQRCNSSKKDKLLEEWVYRWYLR